MEKIKKVMRFTAVLFMLILASVGVGLGPIFGNSKEKYMDAEIRIEHVEKKEEDGDEEVKPLE